MLVRLKSFPVRSGTRRRALLPELRGGERAFRPASRLPQSHPLGAGPDSLLPHVVRPRRLRLRRHEDRQHLRAPLPEACQGLRPRGSHRAPAGLQGDQRPRRGFGALFRKVPLGEALSDHSKRPARKRAHPIPGRAAGVRGGNPLCPLRLLYRLVSRQPTRGDGRLRGSCRPGSGLSLPLRLTGRGDNRAPRRARPERRGVGLSDPVEMHRGLSQGDPCDETDRPDQETPIRDAGSKENKRPTD